jgi:hypothetical protein
MSASKAKWNLEADYIQACNCDYGCPCQSSAPPTRGDCQGMGAWRITRGYVSSVRRRRQRGPLHDSGHIELRSMGQPWHSHSDGSGNFIFIDSNANQFRYRFYRTTN